MRPSWLNLPGIGFVCSCVARFNFFQVFVELSHRDHLKLLGRTACSRAQASAIEIHQDEADTAEDQDPPGSPRLSAGNESHEGQHEEYDCALKPASPAAPYRINHQRATGLAS